MKILYKCALCSAEYGLNGFTNHIQRTHKMKYKDYYDTYIDTSEHLCKICGKPCAFTNHSGYRITCGNPTCVRKVQHEHMYELYGQACRRPEKIKPKPIIEYKYTCALCGHGYKTHSVLNRHLIQCHPEITTEEYFLQYMGGTVVNCRICGKPAKWLGTHYGVLCGSKECRHKNSSLYNASKRPEVREKHRQRMQNLTEEEKQEQKAKREATCLAHFGYKHNWQAPECRKKCSDTLEKTYGTRNGFMLPKTKATIEEKYGVSHFSKSVEFSKRRTKKYIQDGIGFDSKDEIFVYNFSRLLGKEVVHHPDIRFTYTARDKEHVYEPDFVIDGHLIEIKGRQFFENKDPSKNMINPYDRSMDDIFEAKHQCMIRNGVKIITDGTLFNCLKTFYNVDLSEASIFDKCFGRPFPGSSKWASDHPIWDCFVPGRMSPKDAWGHDKIFKSAIANMVKVVSQSIQDNKYLPFCKKHLNALINIDNDADAVCKLILTRFTVAKLAPKVTALRSSDMLKIVNEAKVDLSNGVYCPMAGFGGIVETAKQWFKSHDIPASVEAYDINENFCKWYGWTKRDVLAQIVETDKTVVVCPPFGKKYEHWKGTPDEMSDISFAKWVKLIKEHVKAPRYVFIGPETKSANNKCGLFSKKVGIELYEVYEPNGDK